MPEALLFRKSLKRHLKLITYDKMKKLAFLTGSDLRSFGGGEKDIIGLSNKLKNFDVTIFSFRSNFGNRVTYEVIKARTDPRVKIFYFNAYSMPLVNNRLPLTYTGLKTILRLKDFDVIYSMNSSILTNAFVSLVSKMYKKRFIIGIHSPGFLRETPVEPSFAKNIFIKLYNPVRNMVLRGIPNIRVQNKTDRASLLRLGYKGKIYTVPPHVFDKITIRKHDIENKDFIALFVGRLSIKHKGLDLLSEIIDKTLQKNREIQFHIVGSGDGGEHLVRDLVRKYPKNVKWDGFLSEEDLDKEYRRSSIFLSTSRGENFGISLGEAQGYGIPGIAFRVMGSEDILTKKIQGRLVKPFDINEYSKSIIEYFTQWKKDRKMYMQNKIKISKIASSLYSDEVVVPSMARMFND